MGERRDSSLGYHGSGEMIRVLRDWHEIGEANKWLTRRHLARHSSPEKSWDLKLLCELVEPLDKQTPIVDLGCGDLHALMLLQSLGFRRLVGIDLRVTIRQRIRQARLMWRSGLLRRPFRLLKADATKTGLPGGVFGLVVCVSTIEHGIDVQRFCSETSRLLRDGGLLFLTTDYWHDTLDSVDGIRAFDQPWRPFDAESILRLVRTASSEGLELLQQHPTELKATDRCVVWSGQEYTFICAVFRKTAVSDNPTQGHVR
jgi:SAM-dependent methyltransferase